MAEETTMSAEQALRPYEQRAAQDTKHLRDLADELNTVLMDTAARFVDRPDSAHLFHALDDVSTAHRQLWSAIRELTRERPWELWYADQVGVSA